MCSILFRAISIVQNLYPNFRSLLDFADMDDANDPVLKLLIAKRTEVLEDLQLIDQALTML